MNNFAFYYKTILKGRKVFYRCLLYHWNYVKQDKQIEWDLGKTEHFNGFEEIKENKWIQFNWKTKT